ncbi:MAG TPA: trypsin-like peptidase domain-containing protein [Tepidisphaeraceae bacterium]|nr:trypsin-like peptidase domain-containing protein [Tepidisphaeraceae bacterium]
MLSRTMNQSLARLVAALAFAGLFAAGCASSNSPMKAMSRTSADLFPAATPEATAIVREKVFPAVVRIDVAQEIYSEGKRNLRRGIGSGVIIDDQGHILTNFHVAGRAAELYVTLANKERVAAKLIGDDHWTDVAVIQLDIDEIKRRHIGFSYAELGNSDSLIIGQDVIAIGTPFGLTRTMTLGIVSNNERTFYPEQETIDDYETGEFNNWIQMDTPIAPGNSGGPLVDMLGKVVGINTRGIRGQQLNFAIPINTVKEVVAEILRTSADGKKGHVDRADLGVDLKPLQDLESFYEIDINKGVLINSVERGSPAMAAGLKAQDILLDINGKPINVRFPEEVAPAQKQIASLPVGQEINLTVHRGKETINLKTKLVKLEGAVGEESEFKTWGLSVRDVTRKYANEAQLDDDTGVMVTTLSPGYPAAKGELRSGDVIRSVNQKPVTDLDEFKKLYDEAVQNKQSQILLEVQRGRGRRSAVLNVTY